MTAQPSKRETYWGEPEPGPSPDGITVFRLLAPIVESWKTIVLAMVLAAGFAAGWVWIRGDQYTAQMILTTVANKKQLPIGGSLAASYLNLTPDGFQATPGLVVKLMRMDGVLREIAHSPAPNDPRRRLVDVAAKRPSALTTERAEIQTIDKLFKTGIDQETGTISLRVTHRDSAVARAVALRLISATSAAFQQVARAQAVQLHRAQDVRVDSAIRALQAAEQAAVEFSLRNRTVALYSPAWREQQAIDRKMQVASTVYSQAIGDRESAIAKELEETPAVVVVDPIPAKLSPDEKNLLAIALIGLMVGGLLMTFAIVVRDLLVRRPEAEADLARLKTALQRFPFARKPRPAAT